MCIHTYKTHVFTYKYVYKYSLDISLCLFSKNADCIEHESHYNNQNKMTDYIIRNILSVISKYNGALIKSDGGISLDGAEGVVNKKDLRAEV